MNIFNNNNTYSGFKLIKKEHVPEIKYCSYNTAQTTSKEKAEVYELEHIASKAKLLYLENDDPEKAFSISFKTPPKDSTGVFHILEHSVLCGSRKFPVKEPFTNLLKSSMQTFLNAMTFDDKTMYPVATTNEKDLYNLVDVYMDAVLFPNIYKNINIFYQEGGHKTTIQQKDKNYLGFNGVVFNEMKGAYSEPEAVLYDKLQSNLLPNTCYQYSSGGNPEEIKKLSYQNFLEEHARHYRLDNSYIIIYGNLNFKNMLSFLDKNYLSKEKEINEWRSQGLKERNFSEDYKPREITKCHKSNSSFKQYKMQTDPNNAVCGCLYEVPKEKRNLLAIKVLVDALAYSNESPLKKALLKENIGAEVNIDLFDSIKHPYIFAECKCVKKGKAKNFNNLIKKNLSEVIEKDLNPAHIKAAISHLEFLLKQNLSSYSTGVDAAIAIMSHWLYNDKSSIDCLKYIDDLEWVKSKCDTDYFKQLAKRLIIDNNKMSQCEIVPVKKCQTEEKLIEINKSEANKINKICKDLKKQQEKPDSPIDTAKIPSMKIDDIEDIVTYPEPHIEYCSSIKCYCYEISTNGIVYANRYYKLGDLNFNDLPYVKILGLLLGKLGTPRYNSSEIDVISRDKIGLINYRLSMYENSKNYKKPEIRFTIKAATLEENVNYLTTFIDNIINNSIFDDYNTIQTVLMQQKVGMEQAFIQMGHIAASSRAMSKILPIYQVMEQTGGIDFYIFIKKLLDNFDTKKHELSKKLSEVSKVIFKNLPTLSFAGTSDSFKKYVYNFDSSKNEKKKSKIQYPKVDKINEVFLIPSNVNYAISANNLRLNNQAKANGSHVVASKIASFDYLWNEVRVKSGAYGAGLTNSKWGTMRYYSFRDPNSSKTFKNFNNCSKWLSKCKISQKDLENYIISCVAAIDAPKNILELMNIQDSVIFSKDSFSKRERIRREIINTTMDDIHNAGKLFEEMDKSSIRCIFGSKDLLKINNECNYKFKIFDLFNM